MHPSNNNDNNTTSTINIITNSIGSVRAEAKLSAQRYNRIDYMSCVSSSYARLAIIDTVRGFRVVELSMRDAATDKTVSTHKDNVHGVIDITSLALT